MTYRHVDSLSENGFSSFVLHKHKPFRCTWFENKTPVAYLSDFSLTDQDYLVFPEAWGSNISEVGKGIKKFIFNQNAYYTFSGYSLNKQGCSRYVLEFQCPGFDLVLIETKTEKEVDSLLREGNVFLRFGYSEGFSLPAAEAMSSEYIAGHYSRERMETELLFAWQEII
jgi:hypothetical protein